MTPPPHPDASVRRTARRATLVMVAVWLAVAAALYAGVSWWQAQQRSAFKPYTLGPGTLVIPRGPDGHFRVQGEVNGVPVRFLVDTGASTVSISDALAERAGLRGGRAVTFQTANGPRPGRIVDGVPVRIGPLADNDVSVGVGLVGMGPDVGLLGQSFLRHFEVSINPERMVLSRP
jgi:aspartyl protease family protein